MEFALPHVIVRIYFPEVGPGVGPDLVAALGVHPVEVTEARDHHEARRAAGGRPPSLVVVTDPPNHHAAVAATRSEFPQTPILIVGNSAAVPDAPELPLVTEAPESGWVDTISGNLPLTDMCWHVLKAVSRVALLPGVSERLLGPVFIEVDDRGNVLSRAVGIDRLLVDSRRVRIGESLLPLIEPPDRDDLARMFEQPQVGTARFCTARLISEHGCGHAASVGLRRLGAGRVGVLFQPLIPDGPILGRHINNRDPITGLLTRWAISRLLEESEEAGAMGRGPTLLILKLDNFRTVSEHIGSRITDAILVQVASILGQILPYPAVSSRLMGDTFLTFLPDMGVEEALDRGRRTGGRGQSGGRRRADAHAGPGRRVRRGDGARELGGLAAAGGATGGRAGRIPRIARPIRQRAWTPGVAARVLHDGAGERSARTLRPDDAGALPPAPRGTSGCATLRQHQLRDLRVERLSGLGSRAHP